MAVFNLAQYFTQDGIDSFQDLLGPITQYARSVNVDGASLNDVVRVPLYNVSTASVAFTYANGYSGDNSTVSGKSVTLSNLL